jgi:hypothetical protein
VIPVFRGKKKDADGDRTSVSERLKRPDADGRLRVPEMHICITVRGQELIFEDIVTGQPLHGTQRLRDLVKKEEQRAEMEKQRAELRELGIDPDEITG